MARIFHRAFHGGCTAVFRDGKRLPVDVATSFWQRLIGLIGKPIDDQMLLFLPCRSVHTMSMRVPIDVAALDIDGQVLDVRTIRSWRCGPRIKGTKMVLEARSGRLVGLMGVVTSVEEGKDS